MYKTMESLYELTEQYAAVRDMLFDEDVDEQVINDTLESIEGAIEVKADNYAKIIREMNATAAVIKQEEVSGEQISSTEGPSGREYALY